MHLNFWLLNIIKQQMLSLIKLEPLRTFQFSFLIRKTLKFIIYNLDMRKNKIQIEIFSILLIILLLQTSSCEKPIHQDLIGLSHRGSWSSINISLPILGVPDYTPQSKNHNPEIDSNFDMDIRTQRNSSDNIHNFITFLKSNKGFAQFLITQTESNPPKPYIYIQISNSSYINSRVIQLSFVLERGYNRTKNEWKTGKFFVPVRLFENFKEKITFDVELNFQMKYNRDKQVQISLISQSLGIQFVATPVVYSKSYFLAFALINIIQIVLLLYFGKNNIILGNTSEWLVLQSCLFLTVESIFMFRLALGYYDTNLSYLFFNFVLNLSVMMLILWKFSPVIQKFRQKLHFLCFVAFCILYLKFVYSSYSYGQFWIIQSMIFLWQIVYSLSRGGPGGVSVQLVVVIVLSRLPVLVIMKSEENLLKLEPKNLAANIMIIAMILHLVTIYLQKRLGSRFFVPVFLIPDYFNYLREALFRDQIANKECSICLNKIRQKPNSLTRPEQDQQKQNQKRKDERISYVMTQCTHYFHQSCLNDWLNVHLVCPNCKKTLPPMNLGNSRS